MSAKEQLPLDELETQLMARFRPVAPRTEFVDHLKKRLENPPDMTVAGPPSWKTGFMILVGGLLGGFVLFALIRKLVRWFSR